MRVFFFLFLHISVICLTHTHTLTLSLFLSFSLIDVHATDLTYRYSYTSRKIALKNWCWSVEYRKLGSDVSWLPLLGPPQTQILHNTGTGIHSAAVHLLGGSSPWHHRIYKVPNLKWLDVVWGIEMIGTYWNSVQEGENNFKKRKQLWV